MYATLKYQLTLALHRKNIFVSDYSTTMVQKFQSALDPTEIFSSSYNTRRHSFFFIVAVILWWSGIESILRYYVNVQ